jgi:tetratricopeptide (TPR) repeat protein
MEDAGLRQGLARLVDAEIVFQRGEPPEATYTFKHALVQEAAYESLLKRTRQQLHGRVVDVLRERFPERVESEPEVVARHAEAAGRSDDAITYYGRAGERAQARSAHAEAIGQLRKALGLLATQPAGAERDAREASLQLAIGASLTAIRGYAHPETAVAYERAAAVAGDDAARLGVARTGLGICYFNRGETERGRALAAEVLAAAEARGDREQALLGHVNVAIPEHNQGKFASSLAHCERAIELYDSAQHHDLVRRIASDQGISALNYRSQNLWFLGQPDASLARAREAVAFARRLEEPFSLAYALFAEAVIHWLRRDVGAQRERATEVIALSETQGFPFWLGLGRALNAAARVEAGDAGALPDIPQSLAIVDRTGAQAAVPAMLKACPSKLYCKAISSSRCC